MDPLAKERIRLLLKDWGTLEVLKELSEALRENANNYSDMAIKEKAVESFKESELLDDVIYILALAECQV